MNAANILKPALSRGEIQVIGATTFNEYRKHIEKDAALERRFQPVTVDEPIDRGDGRDFQGHQELLRGSPPRHGHRRDCAAWPSCCSERYITDRFLPDKAIDLLDEACSCASLRNKALAEYDEYNRQIKRRPAT